MWKYTEIQSYILQNSLVEILEKRLHIPTKHTYITYILQERGRWKQETRAREAS